jgi:hypothetical protein
MTNDLPTPSDSIEEQDDLDEGSWLYAHIGRMLGIVGGFATVGLLAFFASLGFHPALYLLLFGVAGVLLIFGGGKIHQA